MKDRGWVWRSDSVCPLWGAEDYNGEEMKAYWRERVFEAYSLAHFHKCNIVCWSPPVICYLLQSQLCNFSDVVLPSRSVCLLLLIGPHQLQTLTTIVCLHLLKRNCYVSIIIMHWYVWWKCLACNVIIYLWMFRILAQTCFEAAWHFWQQKNTVHYKKSLEFLYRYRYVPWFFEPKPVWDL